MSTNTTSSLPPGITDPSQCTLDICPIELATIPYIPTLPGNLLYLAIFVIAIIANLVLGIRYKTWSFMAGMASGGALEVLGYVGRVMLNKNPFNGDAFLMYLICATIAPVFLTAAVYLCLSRVVIVYGESLSFLRPRTYTILFITCDFISLVLQAAGGAIVSTTDDRATSDIGLHIMQSGLIFQVVSLVVFMVLCAVFFVRVRQSHRAGREKLDLNPDFVELRSSRRFAFFLYAFSVATVAMVARCGYRVAELSEGFNGAIWGNEIEFMVLEGALISICVILMTGAHPGWCFSRRFKEAGYAMKNLKAGKGEVNEASNLTDNSST
ncbi:RTA1 like protein-domain-containing protein [Apodospora peruviana]|uniref:RTA1 like protein-domain-containing protein n=1 Tax=Apodospora peruviana TaxID=516989 RepID=A0AAE0IAX4_9PEZI|nr:RTA1 like protein-domain-containing protein [Apodospora peruviana]